jgi:HEAT repeat protein
MRILFLIPLAPLVVGCGADRPITAGGKPVLYWVEALKEPDARVRATAARKLGSVGASDEAALPALLRALTDQDAAVRREVILALVKFGAEAREALPVLAEIRERDPSAAVRACAGKALARLQAEK